jgi:hypothetical protein
VGSPGRRHNPSQPRGLPTKFETSQRAWGGERWIEGDIFWNSAGFISAGLLGILAAGMVLAIREPGQLTPATASTRAVPATGD